MFGQLIMFYRAVVLKDYRAVKYYQLFQTGRITVTFETDLIYDLLLASASTKPMKP